MSGYSCSSLSSPLLVGVVGAVAVGPVVADGADCCAASSSRQASTSIVPASTTTTTKRIDPVSPIAGPGVPRPSHPRRGVRVLLAACIAFRASVKPPATAVPDEARRLLRRSEEPGEIGDELLGGVVGLLDDVGGRLAVGVE